MGKEKTEVLALIPARGGSKSIPQKNIQSFLGHPLIAYSVAAAKQASSVSRVIVSTDDEQIAAVAREYGAETPFMRPGEISQDDTLDLPVFQHALNWLKENENYSPDLLVQLRPTSPLRAKDLVDQAVATLLIHPEADSIRGIVSAGENPHKMWRINENGLMSSLLKVKGVDEPFNAPRQSLPAVFWQTGHIDVIRRTTIEEKSSMSGEEIWPIHIDTKYSVDIDTLSDLQSAESLALTGHLEMVWPGKQPRPLPQKVKLVIFDFDGVITDDRVWVDAEGREQVAANRGDGMGIGMLKEAGIKVHVLSTETNPVVAARCKKLDVPVIQGQKDKTKALKAILKEHEVGPEDAVYLGNDINDLVCFPLVACAVVVNDAHQSVVEQADLRLKKNGGHGAVRELCDLILKRYS